MSGIFPFQRHHLVRLIAAVFLSVTIILPQTLLPAMANTERALYLYYTHTKETARIVFKRNGQYVQSGLNELNHFLRDWRRNEPARMDPRLFDLVWEVYQEVGATQPINVVSAYRSPATNEMLRQTSSGVAENSQHTKGHAMDFFIPGIPLTRLRTVAMRKQVGGVGYYPSSGSPFVHLDTGSVRAWPRMTRAQLKELFPDGRTMHLPSDGKALSEEGYQIALAAWQQCHTYPCTNNASNRQVAQNNNAGSGRTLMDLFFGSNSSNQKPRTPAPAVPAPAMRPTALLTAAQQQLTEQTTIPFSAVGSVPLSSAEQASNHVAPLPAMKSQFMQLATAAALPAGDAVTVLASLTPPPVPPPRLHMSPEAPSDIIAAYLPSQDASRQHIALLGNELSVAIRPPVPATRPTLANTSNEHVVTVDSAPLSGLFSNTFGTVRQSDSIATALTAHLTKPPASHTMRQPELVAPDLEHVADIMTAPIALTSDHFAVIWEHDEADFAPILEMGRYGTIMRIGEAPFALSHTGFAHIPPIARVAN